MMGEHTIILEKDAVPYSVARQVTIPMQKKVKVELNHMEQAGVIKQTNQLVFRTCSSCKTFQRH